MNQARQLRVPKFAEEAVERARLAVVPRQRRGVAPRVPFAILVGLVLLGGVAGLLLFNTHMQKSSFRATALQLRADQLHAQEQQLRLELDRLRDPQVLGAWAKAHGMVPPDAPAFLYVDGRVVGTAQPPLGLNDFRVRAPEATKPSVLRPDPIVLKPEVVTPKKHSTGAADGDSQSATGTKKNQRD